MFTTSVWFLGSIIAGWATYGANKNLTSSWAWRIPTLVQAGIPAIVLVIILFLPESPRWLILHDRQDEGLAIFAKYHGDGDVQSPIVQLEYREVIEDMALHTEKVTTSHCHSTPILNKNPELLVELQRARQHPRRPIPSRNGHRHGLLRPMERQQRGIILPPCNDDSSWNHRPGQTTAHQRHRPHLPTHRSHVRRHAPRQARSPLHDALRSSRLPLFLHHAHGLHRRVSKQSRSFLRCHRIRFPLRKSLTSSHSEIHISTSSPNNQKHTNSPIHSP